MSSALPVPVAVLASGSGSNLQALLDACARPGAAARIALVVVNVPGAKALDRAKAAGVPAVLIDHKTFSSREAFDEALVAALKAHAVEWVCLAGFMRIVGPALLAAYPERIVNIHPSLLPAFPGLHAVRQALAHGVKLTGCTVHLVDSGLDSGPIVVQSAVPVLAGDDEATLAARILVEEHRAYPLALELLARGEVRVSGRRMNGGGGPTQGDSSLRNPGVVSSPS